MNFFKQLQSIIPIVEEYLQGELTWGFEFEGITNNDKDDLEGFVYDYWNAGPDLKLNLENSQASVEEDSSIINHGAPCDCPECDGAGGDTCDDCYGRGELECGTCGGVGQVDCPACGGAGEIDGEECLDCNGSGEVTCDDCSGDGVIFCPACDGRGEVECVECGGSGTSADNEGTFEIVSPIMQLTPQNIQRAILFFKRLTEKFYIETNDTCGFHVHFGLPGRTSREIDFAAVWIKIFLSFHPDMLNTFSNSGMFLSHRYAHLHQFNKVKNLYDNTEDKMDFDEIFDSITSTEKYSLLRRHPKHGTLEWRGPRGMFDNVEPIIYDFLKQDLVMVAKLIRYILAQQSFTTAENITYTQRDLWQWFKKISHTLEINKKRGIDIKKENRFIKQFARKAQPKIQQLLKIVPHKQIFSSEVFFSDVDFDIIGKEVIIKEGSWNRGLFDYTMDGCSYEIESCIWGPNAKMKKGALKYTTSVGRCFIHVSNIKSEAMRDILNIVKNIIKDKEITQYMSTRSIEAIISLELMDKYSN